MLIAFEAAREAENTGFVAMGPARHGVVVAYPSVRELRLLDFAQSSFHVGKARSIGDNPMQFAVNGTLMRGLELNPNMVSANAEFVREAKAAGVYRLWSIGDRHPGMVRVAEGGVAVALEIWEVGAEGLVSILSAEPAGLSVGRVMLDDDTDVLGVLAEPILG